MVTTSLDDLAALLPPDLERPAAVRRRRARRRPRTSCCVVDGGHLPPGNHVDPARRPARRHRARPPERWDELDDATRLRLQFEADAAGRRRPAARSPRCGCARSRSAASPTSATWPPPRRSPAGSRRCTPSPTGPAARRRDHRRRPTSWTCSASATCTPSTRPRPGGRGPPRDRLRVPIGVGDGGGVDRPRHQGVRPAGHGPARPGHRRHRLRQVRAPAHPGARPGDDPLVRDAQLRAGRLQGRRDLRRHVRHAARLGGDHQPRRRAHPGRPHAGRAVRRDGPPPGAAARGRQLRLGPRLREGPRRRRAASRRCRRCSSSSTSSPSCSSAKPEFIDLFVADRPARPLARPAPAAGLAAARGGPAARPGDPPVLPDRPAHVLRRRVARRARRARRLRAAAGPGPRLPQARPVDAAAVQGGVRLRAAVAAAARVRRDEGGQRAAASCRSRSAEVLALEPPSTEPRSPRRRRRAAAGRARASLLDVAVDRLVGHGPAAHQVWLPPLDVPDTLDELLPDLVEDPELGLVSPRVARAAAASYVPLGIVDRPREQRRDTLRVNLVRRGRPRRRRRRPAQRQEHAAAHDRHQPGADAHAARGAVLRARLRRRHVRRRWPSCRTSPASRTRSEPDVVRRIVAEVDRHRRPRARRTSARSGIDSIETYRAAGAAGPRRRRVRRRVPGRRRLEHAARRLRRPRAGAPAARRARPHLRPPPGRRAPPAGRTSGPRCATCSAPGSSCGSATRSTPRSTARSPRWCPTGRPGRGLVPSKLHFLAALPRIDGDADADDPRRRRRGPGRAGRRGLARAAGPKLRLLPERIDARRGPRAGRAAGPPDQRLLLGINEKELAPVGLDVDRRAAPAGLRRRPVRQERAAARPTPTR